MKNISKTIFMLIFAFVFSFPGCRTSRNQDPVLAKIGKRSITLNEFMHRAELTPRPPNFMDKSIVLNNLLAEKLFVVELPKNSPILKNDRFNLMIKGIQEQSMREKLFYKEAYDKVKLDTAELKKIYQMSTLEYDLSFYTVSDSAKAGQIIQKMGQDPESRRRVFDRIGDPSRAPKQTVKWKDPENDVIHDALFTELQEPGTVLGPLRLQDNEYIIMKVENASFHPVIGGEEAALRWNEVKEKTTMKKATAMWKSYLKDIMGDRKIEFVKEALDPLAKIYFRRQRQNGDSMDPLREQEDGLYQSDTPDEEHLLSKSLYKIDDQVYTVKDFQKLVLSHPLVYRKTKCADEAEFIRYFKLAVLDLMRDHFITQKSYQKSMDKDEEVKRRTVMWRDALLSKYACNEFLKSLPNRPDFDKARMKGEHNYLNAHVDSLQMKYAKNIYVDFEAFQKIELTRVPVFAMQQQVPYPVAVTTFPQFTTDNRLDYARKLDR